MSTTETKKLYGILAEFKNPKALIDVSKKVVEAGYDKFDTYSPFPIHGIDKAMSLPKSKLGYILWTFYIRFTGAIAIIYFVHIILLILVKPFFASHGFQYI